MKRPRRLLNSARLLRRLLLGTLVCLASLSSLSAQISNLDSNRLAEETAVANLAKRVAELGQELQSRKVADGIPSSATSGETKPTAVWMDDSDKKWTVKIGGHVQLDYINWANADSAITDPAAAPGTQDYFEFRRLRLAANGTGYGQFDFRLQITLEPETVAENDNVTSPGIKVA